MSSMNTIYNQKTDLQAISEFVASAASVTGTKTGRMLKARGKANLQMATKHIQTIRTDLMKMRKAKGGKDTTPFLRREIALTLKQCPPNIKGVITSIALDYKNNRVFSTPVAVIEKVVTPTPVVEPEIEVSAITPPSSPSIFEMETPENWEDWSDEETPGTTAAEPQTSPKILEKPKLKHSKNVQFSDEVIDIKPVSVNCWGPAIQPCKPTSAHMSVRDEQPPLIQVHPKIKSHRSTYKTINVV